MSDRPYWSLGATRGRKRIHRHFCRYARMPYNWAGHDTEPELLARIVADKAQFWHDACRVCSPELDDALWEARRRRRRAEVVAEATR